MGGGFVCDYCFNNCKWEVLGYSFDRQAFQAQCQKCGMIYTDTAKPHFVAR